MVQTLPFVKCSGAGNDFVLLDNMKRKFSLSLPDLARTLCSRPFGIGADGLLVLEPSSRSEFVMQYYNADGSYGGMCGNGGRCAAMYAYRRGYVKELMRFEALDFEYRAQLVGDEIRLFMKNPIGIRVESELQNQIAEATSAPIFLNTGSPHLVVRVADTNRVEVFGLGRTLRYHARFAPEGTNVNFLTVDKENSITLRTYERGVEGETLACGTGSVASAVASAQVWGCEPPISVHVRSGETVVVSFEKKDEQWANVSLQGSAHILFSGNIFYDDISHRIQVSLKE